MLDLTTLQLVNIAAKKGIKGPLSPPARRSAAALVYGAWLHERVKDDHCQDTLNETLDRIAKQ